MPHVPLLQLLQNELGNDYAETPCSQTETAPSPEILGTIDVVSSILLEAHSSMPTPQLNEHIPNPKSPETSILDGTKMNHELK